MYMLNKILNEIERVSKENTSDDLKKHIIGNLWNLYCNKKENIGITENNELYIVNENPKIINYDNNDFINAISLYKTNKYISIDDAIIILDMIVQHVRKIFSSFGIDIKNHTLDGYCELSQILTIYPLEKLGLKVTKNTAKKCFDYPLNHAFGTVTFNIMKNGIISEKTFLIDATYRQFFTSEKCNRGMYYLNKIPDVGYFVKDKNFAANLIRDGYFILNDETAKKYGEPFYKTNFHLNENYKNNTTNYFNSIINSNEDYVYNISDLNQDEILKL